MKHIISTLVVAALAAVGMVEAKPEVRPEKPVCPIEMKHGKRHGHKHHAHPHRCHKHGVRPMPKFHGKRPHRKPMMSAPIVRPVRKACPAIKRVK